jgi:enterochelin esterase family protein
LTGDFTFWGGDPGGAIASPFQLREKGPGVWTRTLTFPRDAYVEYVFLKNGKRVNDPLNALRTPNGIGGINNSFYGPDAHPNPLLARAAGIPRGRVTTVRLSEKMLFVGISRKLHLYEPPSSEPAALLVALDGQDYLRRANLPALLDNLQAQGKIPPVAAVMLESTRAMHGSIRMSEYACNQLTFTLIVRQVLELARSRMNLISPRADPGAYGIMGASMGGLMALYTALRAPEIFGRVISQAGAFELWDMETPVNALAAQAKIRPRVWLDVGKMDWLLRPNRKMRRHLQTNKFDVRYREYFAYHNWVAWRNTLPDALTWAFGKDKGR